MSWKNTVLDSEKYTHDYFCLETVCRLCWSTDGTINLTSFSAINPERDDTIAEKILECLGIDIKACSYPKKLCGNCLEEIERFTQFKRFCQKSDRNLREITLKSITQNIVPIKVEIEEIFHNPVLSNKDGSSEIELPVKTEKFKLLKKEPDDSDIEIHDSDPICFDVPIVNVESSGIQEKNKQSVKKKIQCKGNKRKIGGKVTKKLPKKKLSQLPTYCSICHLNLESRDELIKHKLQSHGIAENGHYKCYGCEKMFRTLRLRFQHETFVCKALKPGYLCNICDTYLPQRSLFEAHKKAHRDNTEIIPVDNFQCNRCPQSFKTSADIREHMVSHKKRKKGHFVCEICGHVCNSKSNMQSHNLVHSGLKPHKCPYCDHRAAQASSIAIHVRIHTGERPFPCDICSYRTVSSSNLSKHKKGHLDIKDFKCKICEKAYRSKDSLNDHISSVHKKSKPHYCPHCDSHYYRFRELREHLLSKHGMRVKKLKEEIVEVASGVVYKRKKIKKEERSVKGGMFISSLNVGLTSE